MYVDAQPAGARLTLEEGNMCMRFGVLFCYAQIKLMRLQHDPFFRYLEMFNGIVFF